MKNSMFKSPISEILSAQTWSNLRLCVTCTISKLFFDPVCISGDLACYSDSDCVLSGYHCCSGSIYCCPDGYICTGTLTCISIGYAPIYILKKHTLLSVCSFINDDDDDDDDRCCKGRNKPEHFTCNNKT